MCVCVVCGDRGGAQRGQGGRHGKQHACRWAPPAADRMGRLQCDVCMPADGRTTYSLDVCLPLPAGLMAFLKPRLASLRPPREGSLLQLAARSYGKQLTKGKTPLAQVRPCCAWHLIFAAQPPSPLPARWLVAVVACLLLPAGAYWRR